jgi:hypothetical protein
MKHSRRDAKRTIERAPAAGYHRKYPSPKKQILFQRKILVCGSRQFIEILNARPVRCANYVLVASKGYSINLAKTIGIGQVLSEFRGGLFTFASNDDVYSCFVVQNLFIHKCGMQAPQNNCGVGTDFFGSTRG